MFYRENRPIKAAISSQSCHRVMTRWWASEERSGGQRQRIAIARAIIRVTPILIMDEPSSGLDAASKESIFEAIDRLIEGKTSIVIARRFSPVRRANRIFVIEDGRIIESGTLEQLLPGGRSLGTAGS
jgi:ABC-type multidrug transport system fused ATPase/permease subunit